MLSVLCNFLNYSNPHNLSVVKIKFSSVFIKLLSLLLKEGFIRAFYIDIYDKIKVIFIFLKYINNRYFFNFKCLSQSNFLFNSNLNNFDFIVCSTKKGVVIKTNIKNNFDISLIRITIL